MPLRFRAFYPLLLLPALSSCSYAYDLMAVMIDGRLAFVVDTSSDYQPDCLSSINVQADDDGPPASPAPGDDRRLVENGNVYWWDYRDVRSCENGFPIFYGRPLTGPRAENIGYVSAKPLKRGVVYRVDTSGEGAYGFGWFQILANGDVKNYRSDPTPPLRDDDGYLVEGRSDASN